MSNFSFLKDKFEVLLNESVKSESNIMDDPEVSAIYARKALENSIKLVYKIDEDLDEKLIYDLELVKLINHYDFRDIIPEEFMDELHYIRKVGNQAVHSNKTITTKDSLYANKCLYKFQRWIVEVYSTLEVGGQYDILNAVKSDKETKEEILSQDEDKQKLEEENQKLLQELEKLKAALESTPQVQKEKKRTHVIKLEDINEAETRKRLIDIELKEAGYDIDGFKHGKELEYQLTLENGSTGYADYVIWDIDDTPLAVIEAKKFSKDVTIGKHQAKLYTQALEKQFGKSVLTFVSNGRVIEYTNGIYPFREIHSIFPLDELKRALYKKVAIQDNRPLDIEINNDITDRAYQHRVIKSVLKEYEAHKMRALLVMATGTGKTRVSVSLADVMIQAGWARRVLFLADRIELVRQAKHKYDEYLSETSVNLLEEKELSNRMHFGTYETVHNLIQKGQYNSAFFDLIIVDEAHRTIYKKYKAIFEYFDAFILGLTATPADEVHRNTYAFFQAGNEPTDSYDLKEAVEQGYLVDFEPYEIDLGIVKRGIKYSELSEEEQEEFEDKFEEEEKEIHSSEINKRVLNQDTNEKVLQHLFEHGLKIDDGNKIGKTIIFAKNKDHATYIKEVFDTLYPKLTNQADIIHSEISHVQSLIDNFKSPLKDPQIAISVDMLDTGIDVPEILNLVFFKPIKSKIKFMQMIGRGTRLCPNIFGDGEDKKSFRIFDFCENFSYFEIKPKGQISSKTISLKERLFLKRIDMLKTLEEGDFKDEVYNKIRHQIDAIDVTDYSVKKHRHIIEALQANNLEVITDEIYRDIKLIAQYIEDHEHSEVQRFQMLFLNAQQAVLKNKSNSDYINEIKQRCYVIKSKSQHIQKVQEKIDVLDSVIKGTIPLDSIENLESVRKDIEEFANLSLQKKADPVKTNFEDEVTEIRKKSSKPLMDSTEVQTEIKKAIEEFLENLKLLKELEQTSLITDTDIQNIEHHVFDLEKVIENKIEENNDLQVLIKEIINSSTKEVANKVLNNFLDAGNYTRKQTELMIKVKDILFGKEYMNIHDSISNVKEVLFSDLHPISNQFENLSDDEQDDIIEVIKLIEKV